MSGHYDAIAVVLVAVCLFVGSLFGLARVVDDLARVRQEVLIRNALQVFVGEAATKVIAIADWDDAVRNLDNRFDPVWADRNVGKYFQTIHGMTPSFILEGNDRPVYRMTDPRHPEWGDYSFFADSVDPLVAKVRRMERQRGAFPRPSRGSAEISAPIQDGRIIRTRLGEFVVVATLVQPDFGTALPLSARAPILLVCQRVDGAVLEIIGNGSLFRSCG